MSNKPGGLIMGVCRICNRRAGLFQSSHPECEVREAERIREEDQLRDHPANAKNSLVSSIFQMVRDGRSFADVELRLLDEVEKHSLSANDRWRALIDAWEPLVDHYLEDGLLDAEEESSLCEYKARFMLNEGDLDRKGSWTRVLKSGVLRKVMAGELPRYVVEPGFPINFQKNESPAFIFKDVPYLEDVARRQYQGGSQGISVRVMKGVYYRVGAFKGEPVVTTERHHIATGLVVLTDKNVYFWSPSKSLRIPYSKIVSFDSFSDGFGVTRDAATAKPQIFQTGDGWFSYNLVVNLAQM